MQKKNTVEGDFYPLGVDLIVEGLKMKEEQESYYI